MLKKLFAIAFTGLMLTSATGASAASEGCTNVNGFASNLVQVRLFTSIEPGSFDGGEVISLTASSVSSSQPIGTLVWSFIDLGEAGGFGDGQIGDTFASSNDPVQASVVVPTGGIAGLGLTEFGAWFTDLADVAISCDGASNVSYRPASYTTAPDLHQTNVATCSGGKFVSGVQIVGAGKITYYVDNRHKDECFPTEVTVLPEAVNSRDLAAVLAYLGSTDFDIYKFQ